RNVPTASAAPRSINCRLPAPFIAGVRYGPTPRAKLARPRGLRRDGAMKTRKGSLWLAVAAAMLLPSKAKARGRADTSVHRDDSVQKQSRRRTERGPQTLRPVASPDGRHVAEVIGGAVYVDGKRVRTADGNVFVLAPPIWRRDGRAVAWI